MPRPRRPGAPEPKRRSRNGCWPCKNRKVKCGEEKPSCLNCRRQRETCDYSVKLNWGGRSKRRESVEPASPVSRAGSTHVFSFAQSPLPVSPGRISEVSSGMISEVSSGRISQLSPIATHSHGYHTWSPEEPPEFDSLLHMPHSMPWSEQPLHLGVDMHGVLSPLQSMQDRSYPSPAETASDRPFSLDDHPLLSEPQQGHVPVTLSSPSCSVPVPAPASSVPIDFLLEKPDHAGPGAPDPSTPEGRWYTYLNNVTDNYGLDCGREDLDLNKNDDHAAIEVGPALELIGLQGPSGVYPEKSPREEPEEQARYTYYSSPVPIDIPRYLSPLPGTLLKNPINLMYFHHFINHTARMLVPHDCDDNPFISVLPSMAVADSNLLNLTLAYSASHRARYLGQPEPATRIADWVRDVFPTLRLALHDPHLSITDGHLATAVMLLSLKIISPNTFEVPIPWQSHLSLARDLFQAHLDNMIYSANRIGSFLARWLGYIDIMGALSCRNSGPPLDSYYLVINACCTRTGTDDLSVDCFTGFSQRTGTALIELGKLVHNSDREQIQTDSIHCTWKPSVNAVLGTEALVAEFETLRTKSHVDHKHCGGASPTELVAMDQAFCCSALLHLQRRVLNRHPSSTAVHGALNGLTKAMSCMEPGGSAEVGAVFPLFTAGCEAQDHHQRMDILDRLTALEKTGMKQVQNARQLMQRCWDEDMPWISLAAGEFLG